MDAIVVGLDRTGRIKQFNKAAQYLTGYTFNEIEDKYIWDVLIPETQSEGVKAVFNALRTEAFPSQYRNDWISKQGIQITIDWRNSVLLDDLGAVDHVIGTGIDVTQAIKDNAALALSAVAFETQEAMVVTDQNGIILRVNQAFTNITGYSLDEAVGQNMKILQSGRHDSEFYKDLWQGVHKNGVWQGEIWNRRKNGHIFPEWLRITAVLGQSGDIVNYIGNFSEISQQKK